MNLPYTMHRLPDGSGYVIWTPTDGRILFEREDLAKDALSSLINGDEGEESYYVHEESDD